MVDAIDNVKAKLHLLHRCVSLGIPVVSSMGAAARLDPTAIRVEDLCETHMDPFAKDIRKLLKRKYGVPTERPTGITAVYSIEQRRQPRVLRYDADDGFSCVCPNDNDFHSCEHRNQIDGSVAFVTSVFGMNAAGVVVQRLSLGRVSVPDGLRTLGRAAHPPAPSAREGQAREQGAANTESPCWKSWSAVL